MKHNIVLLDPNREHAQLIKSHLKHYSEYEIHIIDKLDVELSEITKLKPSVIFLDAENDFDSVVVEKEIGLMKNLKELMPNAEIIVYSGEERIELMNEMVNRGAHSYIVKSTHTHLKAEALLLAAIRKYKLHENLRFYRKLSIILVVVLFAIIIFGVIGYRLHLITDEVQGPFDN